MATIYEVSESAGVSLATVSRVLNNSEKVSDKTKAKVLKAVEELGYQPSSIARGLASKQTMSVGVVISELHGPFFGPMMQTVESQLRKHNVHAIFAAGHSEETSEREAINFLKARQVDAFILFVESISDKDLLDLNNSGYPISLIGRSIDSIKEKCFSLDNQLGGYLATSHAIARGYQRMVYVMGPEWKEDAKERRKGHLKAIEESGGRAQEVYCLEGKYTAESGYDVAKELMRDAPDFDCAIFANDEMATSAMRIFREYHFDIPSKIGVIGFDNVSYSEYLSPSLTTIDYPIERLAEGAAKIILSSVYNIHQENINNIINPVLIPREST